MQIHDLKDEFNEQMRIRQARHVRAMVIESMICAGMGLVIVVLLLVQLLGWIRFFELLFNHN